MRNLELSYEVWIYESNKKKREKLNEFRSYKVFDNLENAENAFKLLSNFISEGAFIEFYTNYFFHDSVVIKKVRNKHFKMGDEIRKGVLTTINEIIFDNTNQ